ncbi:DUF4407 domain-containing protein [Fulvivirgaceae bacterium PWU5]|uniref:DUF4407 domain-containing protein n=1 Tax=Dawidia cretensis TaxID=2782350 RepID=A0AAP2E526_9BACT|nr:DUF4407 domain-containing protein [Dawidia cretensis]MBT1711964.1 DUF4407 domain-containing protein [Dawidia cretensis]
MRNGWLKFGCFLTGINYKILSSCSELSKKRLLKYTSALLIICLLWMFIGYAFTERYLKGTWYMCLAGSILMIFLIVQIERQVILASKSSWLMGGFRTLIALSMAMIGTVIIDQNMFKDDIEKRKIMTIGDEVKRVFPIRAEEYRRQLAEIDSTIVSKEKEKRQIIDEISKNPFVKIVEQDISYDTAKRKSTNVSIRKLPNPQASLLEPMDKMILALHKEKAKRDSSLIGLRQQIEGEIKANVGFLDELEVMFSLLSESGISFGAWLIWFIFLLALELFILVSKIGELETDYDRRMQQQMELHYRRIALLKQQAE